MKDLPAFKEAMASFPSGVTIVTTADQDGRWRGFTATSFCSVSMDPPLVLTCLANTAQCFPAFAESARWNIHVLQQRHADLAMRFRCQRRQAFDQPHPHRAQFRPMLDQRRIVGRNLARTRVRRLQKGIPGAKRAFVRAKGRPVKRIDLGGEKIQIASPRLRAASDQLDVRIGKGDDSPEAQIFTERPLLDLVQRNYPA